MTAAGWVWMAVAAILAVIDWAAVAARSKLLERCAKPAVLLALLAAALTARPGHAGVHGWLLLALGFGLIGDIALSFASPGQPVGPQAGGQSQPDGPPGSQPGGLEAVLRVQSDTALRAQSDTALRAQSDTALRAQSNGPDGRQLVSAPRPTIEAAAPRAAGAHRVDRVQEPTELPELAQPKEAAAVVGPQPPDALFAAGLASFLLGHLCYCAAMLRYGTDQLSLVFGLVLVLLALLAFGQRILAGAQAQAGTGLTVAVAAYITALGSAVVLGVGTASLWVAYGIVLFAISDLVLASDRFVRRFGWAPITVAVSYHLAQALLVLGLTH